MRAVTPCSPHPAKSGFCIVSRGSSGGTYVALRNAVGTNTGSVLIVDDDDDWRAVMADVLAEVGFLVTTANDGRAALVSWASVKAQVVITDVHMPVMDGCALFAALRSIDRTLPIIVMTAEGVLDESSKFAGAFRMIRKPASTEAVVAAVTDALRRHHVPRRRRLADAARAIMSFGHAKGRGAIATTVSVLRPPKSAEATALRKRRRAGLAVAGLGAAAALAVLIGAIRGLVS